jgi:hypothetical protein
MSCAERTRVASRHSPCRVQARPDVDRRWEDRYATGQRIAWSSPLGARSRTAWPSCRAGRALRDASPRRAPGVFHSQVSVPLQQQGAPVGGDASRRGATTGALPGDVAAGATIHRVPPITSADSGCRSLPAHIETRQPVTALPAHRRSCGTARTQPASAAARVRSSASKSCLPSVSMPQLSGGLSGSRSMMPSTTNRRVQPSGQPVDEGVQSGGALGISQP